jgi:hypothetical protein
MRSHYHETQRQMRAALIVWAAREHAFRGISAHKKAAQKPL